MSQRDASRGLVDEMQISLKQTGPLSHSRNTSAAPKDTVPVIMRRRRNPDKTERRYFPQIKTCNLPPLLAENCVAGLFSPAVRPPPHFNKYIEKFPSVSFVLPR